MIKILPATAAADYECIAQLADTIWRAHYIPIVGRPQIDYMLDKFQSVTAITNQVAEGFEYCILHYGNESVGYVAFKEKDEALFLSKIYVLSAFRGNKIGKAAMTFVEEKAKNYQLEMIRLTVNINNTNAIKAYEKLGFVNAGPLITNIGNGFVMDDYKMLKII